MTCTGERTRVYHHQSLAKCAYRHNDAEWSYIIEGRVRITGIDFGGHYFEEDVEKGDLWFFPAGVPHSLQGLEGGCEFLLVHILSLYAPTFAHRRADLR